MQLLENENLSKHVTFHVGGVARKFYIPENIDELKSILDDLKNNNEEIHILGAGSNLLINDQKIFDHVIYMGKMDERLKQIENGDFYIGASVRLQKLILKINKAGYGGIEYLYSVPGTVGGAIVMNAGRGKEYHESISDFISKVVVWHDGKIKNMEKKECEFSYRSSVFQDDDYVVLGVYFSFPKTDPKSCKNLRDERIKYAKESQDNSKPNFGSLFSEGNTRVYKLLKKCHLGYKNGVHFSGKCNNWLLNEGDGTYRQAKRLIWISTLLHKLLHSKHKLEVAIWD